MRSFRRRLRPTSAICPELTQRMFAKAKSVMPLLRACWPEFAGDLALESMPLRLRNRALVVGVLTPQMVQVLTIAGPEIRDRLAIRFPRILITSVRATVAPEEVRELLTLHQPSILPQVPSLEDHPVPASPEHLARVEAILGSDPHPLREVFRRLIVHSLQLQEPHLS